MPPLPRQQTFGSLHSWWSDSNANLRASPTINLHAAAKPLIKLLYHRTVLEIIRNNRGIPLTSMAAAIYGSYLSFEYVSASTKSAILEDLSWRVQSDDALVVQSNVLYDILRLLEVPVTMDTRMSAAVRLLLWELAVHADTATVTRGSLVALLCDSDMPQVIDGALWVLSRIPRLISQPITTGVSVEAKLLDHVVDILEAPNTAKSRYPVIFERLSHLALHESTAIAIVEANVLNSVEKLLRSRPTDLYWHIFPMLKALASHEFTATALVTLLVTLWREGLDAVDPSTPAVDAIGLLPHIARWREGAEGLVTGNLLDNVLNWLHSLNLWIRLSTCSLLRELVGHESTAQAVVAIVPREDIVALLSDPENTVRKCAADTLQILDATLERINDVIGLAF
ncbi:hypothetical protein C8J57DRAFT_1731886 [Mycena rebaudengoi]|nr:hypothetical protein C8J57DRAFT_1731886 [Mycena rebaudengoi]